MRITSDTQRNEHCNTWVVAEQRGGKIQDVTFELLGAGRRLADTRGQQLWCVVIGNNVTDGAQACIHHLADGVIVVDDPALDEFLDATYANVLARLVEKHKPEIVLAGATAYGRSLVPRVAVKINAGLTADCTGLEIEAETGHLLQTRPAFGGNIMATIKSANHLPQMATVRPRVMSAPEPDTSRTGQMIEESLQPEDISSVMKSLKTVVDAEEAMSLADAQIIIAGGRGVKSKEGFEELKKLAHTVGGAVGASRAAVDAGWIEYAHQVGQTGQTVQPRVYIACGISGQVQHLVGMQSATTIIAINQDPNAPIMQMADYAIVGDIFEIIPAIIDEIRRL
jgi:electron transfer flavoprotein alpha subunit